MPVSRLSRHGRLDARLSTLSEPTRRRRRHLSSRRHEQAGVYRRRNVPADPIRCEAQRPCPPRAVCARARQGQVHRSGAAELPRSKQYVRHRAPAGWQRHGRARSLGQVNFVATPYIQAATTLHELGHNLSLWHGGAAPTWGHKVGDTIVPTYVPPNCNPFDLSVMNYLFQAHGLFKAGSSAVPRGSSRDRTIAGASVNETNVGVRPSPVTPYRLSWFAPIRPGTSAFAASSRPLTRFCTAAQTKLNNAINGACVVRRRRLGGRLSRGGPVWDSDRFRDPEGHSRQRTDVCGDAHHPRCAFSRRDVIYAPLTSFDEDVSLRRRRARSTLPTGTRTRHARFR